MIGGKYIGSDTEGTGLNPWQGDQPFAFSFINELGETAYMELELDPFTRKVILPKKERSQLEAVYCDPSSTKLFFNASYDVLMLDVGLGIKVAGPIQCTLIKSQVYLSGEGRGNYRLKRLCTTHLNMADDDEADLKNAVKVLRRHGTGKAKNAGYNLGAVVAQDYWLPKHFDPSNRLCEKYCVRDAKRAMYLSYYLDQIGDKQLAKIYRQEMELWPRVYAMQQRGVKVSRKKLKKEVKLATKARAKEYSFLNEQYHLACDDPFASESEKLEDLNPNSPKQMANFLFDGLQLTTDTRTKTGQYSTALSSIQQHAKHPVIGSYLRFKAADKSLNTFFGKYYDLSVFDSTIWVLHANFKQCEAVTGRFSCADPNLQQVSEGKTAEAKGAVPIYARRPFLVRKGYKWLLFDYSQLEARIFAHLAQEPFMLQAFIDGRDLHAECANKCFGGKGNILAIRLLLARLGFDGINDPSPAVKEIWDAIGLSPRKPLKAIKKLLKKYDYDIVALEKEVFGNSIARARAKNILFLTTYGGGFKKVSEELGISLLEAKAILQSYFMQFPRLRKYQAETIARAKRDGGIRTVYGRWLRVDDGFEYKLIDYSIQSPAADLIKRAMRKLGKYFDKHTSLDAHMIMQIHDELIIEVRADQCTKPLYRKIKSIMEASGIKGFIDVPVDLSICDRTWSDKVDVDLAI